MTIQEQRTLTALEKYCSKASHQISEIDWEQRRYEIAKDLFVMKQGCAAYYAVQCADNLIEELKKHPYE